MNRWNQSHTRGKTPHPAKRLQSGRCNQTPPVGVRHTKHMIPTTNGDRQAQDTAAPAEGWESGAVVPEALRTALQAARLITDADDASVAQAWFTGCNQHFDFRAPLVVIQDDDTETFTKIVRAAFEFARR